jgi:Holliday junction resolvase
MGIDDYRTGESGNESEYPEEDAVEAIVVEYFQGEFPNVWGDNDHNMDIPDVIAKGENITWGIEVKGDAKNNKQRVYSALGQVVYDMTISELKSNKVKWGVAFPESIDGRNQYRNRIDKNVSQDILDMLDIYVLFVEEDGEVDIIPPGDIGAVPSQ